jgi:hypothetical protein
MKPWATHAQNAWHASTTPSPSPQIGYTLQVCSTHCSIAISYFVTHFVSFHVYIQYTNNSTNYKMFRILTVVEIHTVITQSARLMRVLFLAHPFDAPGQMSHGHLSPVVSLFD